MCLTVFEETELPTLSLPCISGVIRWDQALARPEFIEGKTVVLVALRKRNSADIFWLAFNPAAETLRATDLPDRSMLPCDRSRSGLR
jgi:hypothetical protein